MIQLRFDKIYKQKTTGNQPVVIHQSKNEQLCYKTVCNCNLGIIPNMFLVFYFETYVLDVVLLFL